MKKLTLLLLVTIIFHTSHSQNITAAEYFIDLDPGPGNGTAITPITPGDVVNFSTTVSTAALPDGFHFLAIRVRDANGVWSLFERRGFYISGTVIETDNITAAEYFFDADPGPGNGTALSIGTPGSVVNFTPVIPQSLSAGFHYLAIRTKDAGGKWSLFERRSFYVSGTVSPMPIITAAEYFLDTDPGRGNGTALTITTPGDIVTQTFNISLSRTISLGQHFLGIYVRDQDNNWSQFAYDTLNVKIKAPATDVTVNVAPGLCSQVVNNIDAQLLNGGDPFTYTLTGATTGSGNGNASGLSFNTGVTTVTYTLTNEPTAFSSFTVTVVDNETPTISCPSNLSMNNDIGVCGAIVNYSLPVFNDNCPGANLVRTAGPASGSVFPVGVTTVTHQVTDASGNTASCSFTVTVVDAEDPTITCPSNITVNNATGTCGATVNYTTPTFNDNCPGATINRTAGPASGSVFPVGTTTVTHVVTDAAGRTASCSFTVTVVDAEDPTITCPSNITVNNATGTCGATVNYTTPTFSDNCPGATINRTAGPASGSTFPVGVTTVTHQVTDASGNTASCSFTVTVNDTENPVISCPANITVTASGPGGTVVNYSNPIFSDNCTGSVLSQTAGLPSGSTFPIGVTTNTFLVTDASGNTNTCSFTVTVSPSLPVHLISFTAVKQGTKSLLQWVTENEVNNSHFEVQRSADGVNYMVIGRVNASLSPVDPKHYSFADLQPQKGNNYYRLRQVDIDSRFEYTPVRKLRFDDRLNLLTVYPNPVNDELLVDFSTNEKSVELRLFDAAGKLLLARRMSNELLIRLPVRELAAGIYYLQVNDGVVTAQAGFVKQ
jgi:hypothetical protein